MEERYRKMVDLVKSRKRSLRTRFIRWKDAIR
jgi:hypothetical protein